MTDRSTAAQRMSALIDRNRSEIERRWLETVERDVCQAADVEPTQLKDGLPDYLVALAELLSQRGRNGSSARGREPPWEKVAREHGITRVRIGFDINQLIHEFVVLRRVILDLGKQQGVLTEGPDALLTECLEAAIAAAVKAYVDARDYEARQRQAENIGFLTHELRNPLSTAVTAACELRAQATPEQLPIIEILERSHERLAELIESVLLSERLEAGKTEYHPRDMELEEVLEPALEAARTAAAAKGLVFRASYDHRLHVRLDPSLSRSAIQNLVDNAAKYTDRGYVDIAVDETDGDIVVHVRDSCEGISKEELRTIFEPFKRGRTAKSGSGLGLAIARRAVEAQGGSIGAESCGSGGCHFWISLPKHGT